MNYNDYPEEIRELIDEAIRLAVKLKNRYLMPEHLLYALMTEPEFAYTFQAFGGDADEICRELIDFLKENAESAKKEDLEPTEDFQEVLVRAELQAKSSGRAQMEYSHLFSAILSLEENFGVYFVCRQDVNLVELLGELSRNSLMKERFSIEEEGWEDMDEQLAFASETSMQEEKGGRWKQYVECVSELAEKKNPLIGREKELERTIQILCRMDKNNVLHVGEPGVGKTALCYGLAMKIKEGKVPQELKDAVIYSMDMGTIVAGTQYRGDMEKRFQMVMQGLSEESHPILYLDEIHNVVGAGATGEGSLDVANMLKPYLTDGHIRFIGATTYEEYKKNLGRSKSLLRRFQKVDIPEPSEEETLKILEGLKRRYEKYHGVKYGKDVLRYAVEMSSKFINERFLPDKAIDLIDEAGAYRKLHPLEQKTQTIGKNLIDDMLSLICNVPKKRLEKDDVDCLFMLEKNIAGQVFGQEEAVAAVSNAIKFSRAGLNEGGKPVASFLFVGPTGVGKTEMAKVLAKELGIAFLRFDMSEYTEKHAVAKLIGAPAGYVGYEEGGYLVEEVRKHPHAILLLDEIEKAHPDIFHILLQVMDYATLTDNQGRKADFRNIIVIMTSNAGASEMGKNVIGFGGGKRDDYAMDEAVKKIFQPEFRNRLSRIIKFHGMDEEMALRITKKKISMLCLLMKNKKVDMEVEEDAILWIKEKGVTDQYGAREIDRVLDRELKPLLVDELLFGKLKKGGKCKIIVKSDALSLLL